MNDMALTDMGPFMNRHDRRSRRVFVAMTATSLLLSAAALAYGLLEYSSAGAIPGRLWFPIVFWPLPIIALWMASAAMARVANAGAVFVAGAGVVCIASQAGTVLSIFNVLPSLYGTGLGLARASIVAIGVLMAYFGNAWPRMPTPRGPEHKPAMMIKLNRIYGWMVVTHGLLFVLVGLLLPGRAMFARGAGVISLSMLFFAIVWVVMYYRAVKSPPSCRA